MEFLAFLLCSYGLCFGFMNKLPFLYDRHAYLDALFSCSYCTGFWSAILAWILMNITQEVSWETIPLLIVHGFVGSIFCYVADQTVQAIDRVGGGE